MLSAVAKIGGFVPIIPHGVALPGQKLLPVFDPYCLSPRIEGIPQVPWQRCHSLMARFARPPFSDIPEVSLSSADHRSGRCRLPFCPLLGRCIQSIAAYHYGLNGHGVNCIGSLQMCRLRYCLFGCQGAAEGRIFPLCLISFLDGEIVKVFSIFQNKNQQKFCMPAMHRPKEVGAGGHADCRLRLLLLIYLPERLERLLMEKDHFRIFLCPDQNTGDRLLHNLRSHFLWVGHVCK